MRAFAPGLTTRVLYGAPGKLVTRENIGDVDVLITTPHTKLPAGVLASNVIFHRAHSTWNHIQKVATVHMSVITFTCNHLHM